MYHLFVAAPQATPFLTWAVGIVYKAMGVCAGRR